MIIAVVEKLDEKPKCCDECSIFVPTSSDYGYCPLNDQSYDLEEQKQGNPECPLKEVEDNVLQS